MVEVEVALKRHERRVAVKARPFAEPVNSKPFESRHVVTIVVSRSQWVATGPLHGHGASGYRQVIWPGVVVAGPRDGLRPPKLVCRTPCTLGMDPVFETSARSVQAC